MKIDSTFEKRKEKKERGIGGAGKKVDKEKTVKIDLNFSTTQFDHKQI
jgi:hypothetical protein